MRHYPLNSAQAAARIVTLAMLSDGHLSRVEWNAVERLGIEEQLGLTTAQLHGVVQAFCEDMLATAQGAHDGMCRADPDTLKELAADVTDPALRLAVLRMCAEVVAADGHVADGESVVLEVLLDHWSVDRDLLRAHFTEGAALQA